GILRHFERSRSEGTGREDLPITGGRRTQARLAPGRLRPAEQRLDAPVLERVIADDGEGRPVAQALWDLLKRPVETAQLVVRPDPQRLEELRQPPRLGPRTPRGGDRRPHVVRGL